MILYACTKIGSKYNDVAHLCLSAQQSEFSNIVLRSANSIFRSFKNSMVCLLCEAVVS